MNKLFSLLLLINLISCSSTGIKANQNKNIYDDYIIAQNLESLNKITSFVYRGWNSLDNKHLILNSSFKNSYLITLSYYCNELNITQSIILDQSISNQLSTKFDSIVVPNHNFQQNCRIETIHKTSQDQRKELTALRKNSKNS